MKLPISKNYPSHLIYIDALNNTIQGIIESKDERIKELKETIKELEELIKKLI